MPSLTSVLPDLAPSLGLTPQALYERKRALIKLDLLPSPQGRGRRSGAVAGPETVALLVIAVMVTDNLSDTDDRVRRLASAPFVGKRRNSRCPITNAATFRDALAFLLSDRAPISRETDTLLAINVSRFEPKATISYFMWPELKEPVHTEFGLTENRKFNLLSVNSELPHDAFLEIRQVAIREAEKGKK